MSNQKINWTRENSTVVTTSGQGGIENAYLDVTGENSGTTWVQATTDGGQKIKLTITVQTSGTIPGGSDTPGEENSQSISEYKVYIDGTEVKHLSKIQRKVGDIITITATEGISVSSRRAYLARTNAGTKFEFKIEQQGNCDITIARSKTGEQMTVTVEITDKELTAEERKTVTESNKTSELLKLEFCDGSGTSAKNSTLYKRDIGQSDTLFVYATPKAGMNNSVAPVITLKSENPDLATAYVGIFDESKYEGRPYVGIPFQWPKGCGEYTCYYYQIQTVTKAETPAEGVKIKMYVDGVYETCFYVKVSNQVWEDKIEIVFGNNNYGESDLTPITVLQGQLGTVGITPHYSVSGKNGAIWIVDKIEAINVNESVAVIERPKDDEGKDEMTNWLWVAGVGGGKTTIKIKATYKDAKNKVSPKEVITEDELEIIVKPFKEFTEQEMMNAKSKSVTFTKITGYTVEDLGIEEEYRRIVGESFSSEDVYDDKYNLSLSSSIYDINKDYQIDDIEVGSTVYDLYSNVEFTELPIVYDLEGNSLDVFEELKTGMMAVAEEVKYDLIVKGDANGDGKVTVIDLLKEIKHIIELNKLDGVYLKAADLNKDGKVNTIDIIMTIKTIIK